MYVCRKNIRIYVYMSVDNIYECVSAYFYKSLTHFPLSFACIDLRQKDMQVQPQLQGWGTLSLPPLWQNDHQEVGYGSTPEVLHKHARQSLHLSCHPYIQSKPHHSQDSHHLSSPDCSCSPSFNCCVFLCRLCCPE